MEEEKYSIWHKIEPNHKYRIWRKDYNGNTYYNIKIEQRNYDGTKTAYYVPVTFKKGVEVANETDILIIKAIENLRPNNNVEPKLKPYCPIFSYMITEFDTVERQEQIQRQAIDDYNEIISENEYVSIDDSFLD